MGRDARELYGPRDPDAPALGASQVASFRVPRGTSPPPFGCPFVARAVIVDNPSGTWYALNGRIIPPWTLGASVVLPMPTAELVVVAAAPSGQLSDTLGGDMTLVATDSRVQPSPGSVVPPRLEAPANQQFSTADMPLVAANTLSAPQLVVAAPGAGFRLRVWAWRAAFFNTNQLPLRTYYRLQDGAGARLADQSAVGFEGKYEQLPGVACPTNQSVKAVLMCNIASTGVVVGVYWTVEPAV